MNDCKSNRDILSISEEGILNEDLLELPALNACIRPLFIALLIVNEETPKILANR